MAQRKRRESSSPGNGSVKAVLDTALDAMITIDSTGIMQSLSPAGQRMFGYKASEAVGRKVSMLMPAPDAARQDAYIAQYLRTGRAKIIGVGREVVGRRKDGSTFPVSLAVSPIRVGNRLAFAGILRDLTEQKELEREVLEIAEREQRRIGQDLHDGLCQQLAGIAFLTNTLQRRLASNARPEAAEAKRVTELLSKAIDQARGQSRALNPVEPKADGLEDALRTLAGDVSTVYAIRCEFRGGTNVRKRDGGPSPFGDALTATHLFRIAQEAVNNAVHHGKAKRVAIILKSARDGAVTLSVEDNGVGFPQTPRLKSPHAGGSGGRKWWGMGLRTMSHRAHLIGGGLRIGRARSGGARIVCRVRPTRR